MVKKVLLIRIDSALHRQLSIAAAVHGVSMAQIVCALLEKHLLNSDFEYSITPDLLKLANIYDELEGSNA